MPADDIISQYWHIFTPTGFWAMMQKINSKDSEETWFQRNSWLWKLEEKESSFKRKQTDMDG